MEAANTSLFRAVAERQSPCKCCGAASPLYGVVDFTRNCAGAWLPGGLSGIPIYYYRCPACQFLFSTAFDGLTKEQFRQWIYNDHYALVDPEYEKVRPIANAETIAWMMSEARTLRILDYGAGSGLCASILREKGLTDVHAYDPLVPKMADRPSGRFDCIFCVEVIEHSIDPKGMLNDMASMLNEPAGIIVMSTLFQPPDFDRQGMGWWYIGPRNGHVSLFSAKAMDALLAPLGLHRFSYQGGTHLLARQVPPYARKWEMVR